MTDQRQQSDFVVDKSDLRRFGWLATERRPELAPGEIELGVERFAFTSNNITYAKYGDVVDYWRFFPAPPGHGRIPVWGVGKVERSRCPEIPVGETIYGYLPMSSHVVLQPAQVAVRGFADAASHRATLAPTYNEYRRLDSDPAYDPAQADAHLVLRPLFSLAFFLAEFLRDAALFGARRVLVTSASSKTALALAERLRTIESAVTVGLTSSGNRGFVQSTGAYDEVAAYDAVESFPASEPVVIVDIAGNPTLLRGLHQRLGGAIRHSCRVGATHDGLEEALLGEGMPGPKPEFFFTPHHIVARRRQWGEAELADRLGTAWREFVEGVPRWLAFRHSTGREAVESVYREVLEGRAPPTRADILTIE